MLVVSRGIGERIMIDDHIILTVLEIRGNQVRIGIDAPRSIPVHREEVYEEIQAKNQMLTT